MTNALSTNYRKKLAQSKVINNVDFFRKLINAFHAKFLVET